MPKRKITAAERKARSVLKEAYIDRLEHRGSSVACETFVVYEEFFNKVFPGTDTSLLTSRWFNEWKRKKGGMF